MTTSQAIKSGLAADPTNFVVKFVGSARNGSGFGRPFYTVDFFYTEAGMPDLIRAIYVAPQAADGEPDFTTVNIADLFITSLLSPGETYRPEFFGQLVSDAIRANYNERFGTTR